MLAKTKVCLFRLFKHGGQITRNSMTLPFMPMWHAVMAFPLSKSAKMLGTKTAKKFLKLTKTAIIKSLLSYDGEKI